MSRTSLSTASLLWGQFRSVEDTPFYRQYAARKSPFRGRIFLLQTFCKQHLVTLAVVVVVVVVTVVVVTVENLTTLI